MPNSDTSLPSLQLPNGGILRPFPSLRVEPLECTTVLNLQTQIAPLVALMDCEARMLQIMKPLIEIVQGLPNPSLRALQDFNKAAIEIAPCLLSTTRTSLVPFLRDFLCLEIRSLNCLRQNLTSVSGQEAIQTVLGSYRATVGLLNLAGGLLRTVGLQIPAAPNLSGGVDAASLSADDTALRDFIAVLTIAADSLGGC